MDNLAQIEFDDTKFKIDTNIDLNTLFNLNYNFDALKGVIEQLLKNQKALSDHTQLLTRIGDDKDKRILKLEKEIGELKENQIDKSEFDDMKNELDQIKNHLKTHDDQLEENKEDHNKLSDKIDSHDDKIQELGKNFDLHEEKIREIEKKLGELSNRVNDIDTLSDNFSNFKASNIKEINNLKDIINNLPKAEVSKNYDDDIKSINERLEMMNKNYISADKNLQNQIDELKNLFESKIKELSSQIDLLMLNPSKGDSKVGQGDLKVISELNKRQSELERKLNDLLSKINNLNNDQLAKELEDLSDQLSQKADKKELIPIKEDINSLKDRCDSNEKDIKDLKSKLNEALRLIEKLKYYVENNPQKNDLKSTKPPVFSIPEGNYVNLEDFNIYKNEAKNEFDKITKLIGDLFQIKAEKKDLEALKDYLLAKMDEIITSCVQRFADKNDTSKNFKYLESQIKKLLALINSNNSSKCDHGENWLIAKKPLYGFSCASCESYIGELNDNKQYVPWNKYPLRDPNEKLYRIGNGFSNMLKMLSLDEKDGQQNIESNTNNNFYNHPKKNLGVIEEAKHNPVQKRGLSANSQGFPKISHIENKADTNSEKIDNNNYQVNVSKKNDENDPKITRITKLKKNKSGY